MITSTLTCNPFPLSARTFPYHLLITYLSLLPREKKSHQIWTSELRANIQTSLSILSTFTYFVTIQTWFYLLFKTIRALDSIPLKSFSRTICFYYSLPLFWTQLLFSWIPLFDFLPYSILSLLEKTLPHSPILIQLLASFSAPSQPNCSKDSLPYIHWLYSLTFYFPLNSLQSGFYPPSLNSSNHEN